MAVGIVAFVGLLFLWLGLATLWTGIQALRARSTSPGDVGPGPVIVEGSVSPVDGTAEAPYSEADCVAFDATVEKYVKNASQHGGSNHWEHQYSMADGTRFELRDSTGTVHVEPTGAEFYLERTFQEVSDRGEPAPGADEGDASSAGGNGLVSTGIRGNHRYTERRLDAGDDAWILGVAAYESGPGSTLTLTQETTGDGLLGRLVHPPFVIADRAGRPFWRTVLLKGLVPTLLAIGTFGLAGYIYFTF